jgi:hypothetical protein
VLAKQNAFAQTAREDAKLTLTEACQDAEITAPPAASVNGANGLDARDLQLLSASEPLALDLDVARSPCPLSS